MASQSDNDELEVTEAHVEEIQQIRKASDILVSLEKKIDMMNRITAGQDLNSKLMLDRLNRICVLLEGISQFSQPSVTEPIVALEDVQDAESEAIVDPIVVETNPTGFRRTARPESYPTTEEFASQDKVVAVAQKITWNDGKPALMAEIEIRDQERNLVAKSRTNTGGKWQAPLKPGNYTVVALKRESGNRKRMEYKGEFTVEPGQRLELPEAILK